MMLAGLRERGVTNQKINQVSKKVAKTVNEATEYALNSPYPLVSEALEGLSSED
jgi:TPP-dependent pyruvate/acetoin dehydrogenase alpha subunit